ncbi:hypothetical protein HK099_004633 [Clydaea vesicula]|uniref:Uncharacterized protein n=1 Tax=Clydaea vesicula TaxID=447962 RepID=A0AAD5U1P6_9FUNG|nr:hypothetical protein HK099_004633 [Clydaea vesicula]KAJ3385939.1 hypothetical protein HDU92_002793 [Lobulomyces angularis]
MNETEKLALDKLHNDRAFEFQKFAGAMVAGTCISVLAQVLNRKKSSRLNIYQIISLTAFLLQSFAFAAGNTNIASDFTIYSIVVGLIFISLGRVFHCELMNYFFIMLSKTKTRPLSEKILIGTARLAMCCLFLSAIAESVFSILGFISTGTQVEKDDLQEKYVLTNNLWNAFSLICVVCNSIEFILVLRIISDGSRICRDKARGESQEKQIKVIGAVILITEIVVSIINVAFASAASAFGMKWLLNAQYGIFSFGIIIAVIGLIHLQDVIVDYVKNKKSLSSNTGGAFSVSQSHTKDKEATYNVQYEKTW